MYIDSKQMIAAYPSLKIRWLLRRIEGADVYLNDIANKMGLGPKKAQKLVSELLNLGYLQLSDSASQKECYEVTDLGRSLAAANAGKRITRKATDAAVTGFMARVRRINEDSSYIYSIASVLSVW